MQGAALIMEKFKRMMQNSSGTQSGSENQTAIPGIGGNTPIKSDKGKSPGFNQVFLMPAFNPVSNIYCFPVVQ